MAEPFFRAFGQTFIAISEVALVVAAAWMLVARKVISQETIKGLSDLTVVDSDATPILEFEHDVGRVEIHGVTIDSPRVNWGNDSERVRAGMLRAL